MRKYAWSLVFNVSKSMIRTQEYEMLLEKALNTSPQDSKAQKCRQQIEKDVTRTFAQSKQFQSQEAQNSLYRLLMAYS